MVKYFGLINNMEDSVFKNFWGIYPKAKNVKSA
jgi:hypothetical protein